MRASLKCTSVVLMLALLITSIGCFGVSAEEYTVPDTFLYGDVDLDGSVTVRDATAIQKGLAEITYLTGVQKFLADPVNVGVTIRNATEIQKHVAGIHTALSSLGTPIEMATPDEFSRRVSVDDNFKDDCIIVVAKLGFSHDYSLEDFPEYEFESVSVIGDPLPSGPVFYLVHLKEHSKDNVIDAIKALDYRANLDLIIVQPNYLYELA